MLIKVHAAFINSRDWRLMRAKPSFDRLVKGGLLRPKNPILGVNMAGQVEDAGSGVRQFQPGDEIFGYLSRYGGRTFAEYVCAGENEAALKPDNVTFEQAAAVPLAALTALQALRNHGNIQPGQKVLINGASGGVGTFAVQIAKAFGTEVTAVCSTRNMEMVRSIGADHAIDDKNREFTQDGQQYDLILAVNGNHPISDYLRALKPEGIYVVAGGSMAQLFQAATIGKGISNTGRQKTHIVSQVPNLDDLLFLKDLCASGKIMPVIDACYPLSKTPDAFWYFEKAHPMGKVVITMEENQNVQGERKTSNAAADRYIAHCGNDCTQCPLYKYDCMEGCRGTACANYCETCAVRLCNRKYSIANCAQCEEYPCQILEKQYENMAKDGYGDWALAARKALEEIQRG